MPQNLKGKSSQVGSKESNDKEEMPERYQPEFLRSDDGFSG